MRQVYVTILASLPTTHPEMRSSINRNLTDIVELHEEILGELHRVVPKSEYAPSERPPIAPRQPTTSHHRWHSLDSVPENRRGQSQVSEMTADPDIGAEVAGVFAKRVSADSGPHFVSQQRASLYTRRTRS